MQKKDTEEATYSQLNNEVEERAVGHKKGEERPLQKKEVQEGADRHKRGEERPLEEQEFNRPNTPRKRRPCRKLPLSSSTPSLNENKKGYKLGNKCTKQALDFRVLRLIGDI